MVKRTSSPSTSATRAKLTATVATVAAVAFAAGSVVPSASAIGAGDRDVDRLYGTDLDAIRLDGLTLTNTAIAALLDHSAQRLDGTRLDGLKLTNTAITALLERSTTAAVPLQSHTTQSNTDTATPGTSSIGATAVSSTSSDISTSGPVVSVSVLKTVVQYPMTSFAAFPTWSPVAVVIDLLKAGGGYFPRPEQQ